MRKLQLIDFNDAVQHPGRLVRYEIETALEQEADLDLLRPMTGYVEGVSTGNALMLNGEFKTVAVLECARCLQPVEVPVAFEVSETFPISGTAAGYHSGGYAEVVDDDVNKVFEGNQLLIEELLRQDVWLHLPPKTLCSEDCPGIASEPATKDSIHPAFSSLADLKENETDR